MTSAALNSAIAVGAAAQQRSEGGCYANCPPGTACNPATGYCERAADICIGAEAESPRCLQRATADGAMTAQQPGPPRGTALPPGIGISPATGSTPTLPPERPAAPGVASPDGR
jgi:hypothetical protein